MLRFLLVVCAAASIAGCGTQPRPRRPGQEFLAAIRIEGSRAIDADELRPGLALDRARIGGRAIDPYQLSVDTDRIRAAYVRLGYFEATVAARIDTAPKDGAIAQIAVFTVVAGRRSAVEVEIRGLPPEVNLAAARRLVELADGAPFDYEAYDAAKEPLLTLIEDAGYPHAEINAGVLADRERAVAVARFEVVPGVRVTFGQITIEGVTDDLADAVRGRLGIAPGQPYSRTAMARSQRDVYDLGRFSSVRFEPGLDQGAVVPVKVTVSATIRGDLRLGGGGGRDIAAWEIRARGAVTKILQDHPLWTLAADTRVAYQFRDDAENGVRARAIGSVQRLELFRPYVRGELEGSFDLLQLEAYTTVGPRLRAGLVAPLGVKWLQGRVGALAEYLDFAEVRVDRAAAEAIHLDDQQVRAAVELAIDANGRDDDSEPRNGWFATVRTTFGKLLDEEGTYGQVTPEVRRYIGLPWRFVLALRVRAGFLFGTVPVTERYYSGGASQHRGFADRRLSPTLLSTEDTPRPLVVGGVALVETGGEVRIPLYESEIIGVGTHLFLDGGDVVARRADLDVSNLHWATGVGVYVKVFGLKIRSGVGYRLNRTGPGEPQAGENFAWHISVGDAY